MMGRRAVLASMLVSGIAAAQPAAPARAPVVLPIAARAQAPESPREGWCGETAIQEGLLHLGAWAPQRLVNRAGRPTHPDLYSPEIPVALSALGVRFERYAGPLGYGAFARWAKRAIDEGDPVLAGVKILPTEHPEWGLDHFVLVVGYSDAGLLVDTTWGDRRVVAEGATRGLSLDRASYGLRLRGRASAPGTQPARLTVLEESATAVKLRVACGADAREVTIDPARIARFDCPRR